MGKEDTAGSRDETHREVVAILESGREAWWQAERVAGLMCGYESVGGQRQGAGDDRPFDLRSPGDLIRIDVKTQQGNELDVKKEKPSKQFLAWEKSGKRFVPVQLVLDGLSEGWYVVVGIPLRTADVVLDPLVTEFDAEKPTNPFLIGRCLLPQLRQRERFDAMTAKLKEALEVVERHREVIQALVDEEHRRYVASVAEDTLEEGALKDAVVVRFGQSKEVMNQLGQSREAMDNLAQSDEAISNLARSKEAMSKLAQSDEAMSKLAQSDEAMSKLAQSDEAMSKLAKSDEAMSKLAQSDEAMSKLAKAAKKDPSLRAKLLALLGESEEDEPST